jgi:hypothetical protein
LSEARLLKTIAKEDVDESHLTDKQKTRPDAD